MEDSVGDASIAPVSWIGSSPEDRLGVSVAMANIDGDDYMDIVLGAPGSTDNGTDSGKFCIFLGSNYASWSVGMELGAADFCFYGEASDVRLGFYLSNAGDLNSDGLDEIAIASCGNDDAGTDYGKVYVLYPNVSSSWSLSENINLASTQLTGLYKTTSYCSTYDTGGGLSVTKGADYNGDGYDDLLIGQEVADTYDGSLHIFYGDSGVISSGSLSDADVTIKNDDVWLGQLGKTISVADVDGDGTPDILAGFDGNSILGDPDGVFLIYGDATLLGSYQTSALNRAILEYKTGNYQANHVYGPGDLNGDGYADLFIGISGEYDTGSGYGIATLINGSSTRLSSSTVFSVTDSILYEDNTAGDSEDFGFSFTHGDFDGDGNPEVFIGAPGGGGGMVYQFEF
jgi:hypothetical protein